MRSSPTRAYRGTPADERRAQRRDQLVEAGFQVIGSKGLIAAAVRAVCAEAGLTARYFYEAFDDGDALLVAVYERVLAAVTRAVTHAVTHSTAGSPRDRAREAIAAAFELLTDDPRAGRVLLLEAANSPVLQRRRQDDLIASSSVLAQLAGQHFTTRPVDPVDAQLTALALVGAETELGAAYLAGRLPVTRERLIGHITELHLATANASSDPKTKI
jgi:AcrR family transcriptional regulator